jgi:hypothetical protein
MLKLGRMGLFDSRVPDVEALEDERWLSLYMFVG